MYGANRALYNMICLLKKQYGVEPYVLVSGGGPIIDLCEDKGISCFDNDFRISVVDEKIKHKDLRKLTRRIMRYKEFISIAKKIEKSGLKFDLVHSNSGIFDIGLFLAERWRIPHVWHVREFTKEDYGLESIFTRKEILNKYRKTDVVVVVSGAVGKKINSYGENINICPIYDGINICEKYEKIYNSDGVTNFCIVGSLNERKGQLDCVKACELLKRKNINNFKLYIVGEKGGDYFKHIEKYIEEHADLKDHIVFTGYCNNVDEILKKMDVGIMASYEEAFGLVTVEYMANYMPVIGTDTGGTPEILAENGKFFKPSDVSHLADYMAEYIQNQDYIRDEGAEMRIISEKFTSKNNARQVYDIYRKIIKTD